MKKALYTRILKILSITVISVFFLSIITWASVYVHEGGTKLGIFTMPVKKLSTLPVMAILTYNQLSDQKRLFKADPDFQPVNGLNYDLYAMNAYFDKTRWVIELKNLKNDSVLHAWYLLEKNYNYTNRVFSYAEPRLPVLLKDRSIVTFNDESRNLYKLDRSSNIVWHNREHQFHHSIQPDHQNNIWACTREITSYSQGNICYYENFITKIDSETGETLFNKPISEILLEHDLSYLIHGVGNSVTPDGTDPFHLNEIEPVLKDGPYWEAGDLFISLRHRSLIMLYRPRTNKVLRIIQGPFFNHHDVDIVSDSSISIFNNNISAMPACDISIKNPDYRDTLYSPNTTLNKTAEVLVYHFKDSSFKKLYTDQFIQNKIFTATQGLHKILKNGDLFVESQNEGKIFIFNTKLVLSRYYNTVKDGRVEPPHWVRLYEHIDM